MATLPVVNQPQTIPSVLDRLLDDNPRELSEHQGVMYFDLRRFKQTVARDLQALLNTRCVDIDGEMDRFPHVRNSILNFGITDLSSLSLLNPDDRLLLRDNIRITIEQYEPRLARVRVTLASPREFERMLRFRVDAVLKVHPQQPPLVFDATLQLSSNAYHVGPTGA